jgi:septum formation inhibitor-activating ATPase MinD
VDSAAVFIGGRSGVGKTSIGFEIHAQLSAAGIRHCLIDGDYLDMAYPPPWEHGLAERNLAMMWSIYRALGYRRLVYLNTASVLPEVVDSLTAAMGDGPTVCGVLLTCTQESARERLSRREIGSTPAAHLASSTDMASQLQRGAPSWVHRITTDDRTVADIAAEVIELIAWQHDPPVP